MCCFARNYKPFLCQDWKDKDERGSKKMDFGNRISAKKLFLSEKNKKAGLDFGKKYRKEM